MKKKIIALGGDHAGYQYKQMLIEQLQAEGYEVRDFGPSSEASVDYPDFAHPLAEAVSKGECSLGILICGSGNGVAITANKHADIRAALCWNTELAALARQHNNANVLCLPARFISRELAVELAEIFLSTEFEGGRHEKRVAKISC
ncbi:MAG: ribose 5-phosphate isomerase B [Cyclobacteriaceae bacterium]